MNQDHTRGVESTAAIAGHPIHPMLVPFPITLLISALVTDLVHLATGDPSWATFSFWLIAAGLVTGLAAGVAGAIDFFTLQRPREHTYGWIHAVGNVLAILLALSNVVLRLANPALTGSLLASGLILSAITAGVLVITGWYGGELAYRDMIGVTGHQGGGGSDYGPKS
ncbi:MAG: DUF2231 domain-containing protein [Chloroflexi bacterium]|nr:DUF2231 domain-containing protein [Chloroflexota bacterium]